MRVWSYNILIQLILYVLQMFVICRCLSQLNTFQAYQNINDTGYGITWVYFPDGDDIPHYVNLNISEDENRLSSRILLDFAIEYRLYIRNNTEDYIILGESADSLYESNLETLLGEKPLKIVTHGWRSSADKDAVTNIRNAYLSVENVNVITIDWSELSDIYLYHWVVYRMGDVGSRVGIFLNSLNKRFNVTGDQIHLIGHSLGAHLMGIAASRSNLTIGRVTGLDPAGPLFEYQDNSLKLDFSDAMFVDIIHTCGGILGISQAIGNADFFPNSGMPPQPGCGSVQKIFETCSHGRSYIYYAESITNPKAFPAYQCSSWSDYIANQCIQKGYMGEEANDNLHGKFYLHTNSLKPFGRSLPTD